MQSVTSLRLFASLIFFSSICLAGFDGGGGGLTQDRPNMATPKGSWQNAHPELLGDTEAQRSENDQILTGLINEITKVNPEVGARILEVIPTLRYKVENCASRGERAPFAMHDRVWTTLCHNPKNLRSQEKPYLLLSMAFSGILKPTRSEVLSQELGYATRDVVRRLFEGSSLKESEQVALQKIQMNLIPKAQKSSTIELIDFIEGQN